MVDQEPNDLGFGVFLGGGGRVEEVGLKESGRTAAVGVVNVGVGVVVGPSAAVQQDPDNVGVPGPHRNHQRRGPAAVGGACPGPHLQELRHQRHVLALRRPHQDGGAVRAAEVGVGPGDEQVGHEAPVLRAGGVQDRSLSRDPGRVGVGPVPQQLVQHLARQTGVTAVEAAA